MSDSISRFDDDNDDDRDDVLDDLDDRNDDLDDGRDDDFDDGDDVAAAPAPATPVPATPGTAAPAVQVTRLYDAAFNRQPDSDGLAFWTNALQVGASLDAIADAFVASPEFQSRYGGTDNDDFVGLLYRNVLGREGDDDGEEYWDNGLDAGRFDHSDVLLAFAQSPEFAARAGSGDDDLFG